MNCVLCDNVLCFLIILVFYRYSILFVLLFYLIFIGVWVIFIVIDMVYIVGVDFGSLV